MKDTNPKDAAAITRLPLGLVPDTALILLTQSFAEGAIKYGQYNWRIAGVRVSVYVGAIGRHLMKFWNGEWTDPKTKVPHLASIMAGCAIIEDARLCGKLTDDRPPALDLNSAIAEAEATIANLTQLFAEHQPTQWTQEMTTQRHLVEDETLKHSWFIDKGQQWRYHTGGPMPVEGDVKVYVRFRDGTTHPRAKEASSWDWAHYNGDADITAWILA